VAAAAVFPRELRKMARPRNLAIGAAAAAMGALPLLVYNLRQASSTLPENAAWSGDGFVQKAYLPRYTLDGSAIFGEMMRQPAERPGRPRPRKGSPSQSPKLRARRIAA